MEIKKLKSKVVGKIAKKLLKKNKICNAKLVRERRLKWVFHTVLWLI